MITADIYRPEQWHDFFLLAGTGAVTLTGLIFVALTIHLKSITQDIVHRSRALSSLTGLTAAFIQCALAMLPEQSHKKLGVELTILAIISLSVFLWGIYRTYKRSVNPSSYSHWRTFEGAFMYLTELIGAGIFISGHIIGLYIVVLGMLANLLFIVSGAWLLVVGPATKS